MDLLIKGGTVVTATSSFKADVAVKNGKISAIGANLKPEKKTEVVDAKGKMILLWRYRRSHSPGNAFRWNSCY